MEQSTNNVHPLFWVLGFSNYWLQWTHLIGWGSIQCQTQSTWFISLQRMSVTPYCLNTVWTSCDSPKCISTKMNQLLCSYSVVSNYILNSAAVGTGAFNFMKIRHRQGELVTWCTGAWPQLPLNCFLSSASEDTEAGSVETRAETGRFQDDEHINRSAGRWLFMLPSSYNLIWTQKWLGHPPNMVVGYAGLQMSQQPGTPLNPEVHRGSTDSAGMPG